MADDNQTPAPAALEYHKTEDFSHSYANNVFMENSAWDLKMIFGELDQALGPNVIVQHSAVSLSWPQVKVLHYFLGVHLAFREAELGRISIPANVINPPPPPDEATTKASPAAPKLYEILKRDYDKLMEENPEARPIKHS